jgi:glucarate dehydratase
MHIQDMRITPIAVADPPLRNAAGLHAPYALRTVIELVTNDGLSGLSEIPGNIDTDAALRRVSDIVVGSDPFKTSVMLERIRERHGAEIGESRGEASFDQRTLVHVFSAVEVACLDLMGKATNRRVCDLLGGAVRERVPFAAYLFYKEKGAGGMLGFGTDPTATGWAAARQEAALDPDGIVRQAKAMCAEFGFRSIKLKGGAFPPEQEVAAILALREAFGSEVPLRLDPNAIWTLKTAVAMGRKLEGALEYYEDPVRGKEDMARLGRLVKIPRATNMCTTSFEDLPAAVALGSEDIILSDHHFWGGLRACVELGRFCRAFGRGLSMHSNSHIGISLAAMVQLGAAVPNLTYALDTHYPWQSDEVVAGGRLRFEDGAVAVPSGPGLGVELDRAALERLHRSYTACGLVRRNDEVQMRTIEPDWTFKAVRW